jgi:hypothetical protein
VTTYITYFDRNYLDRGIALISSVRNFDRDSKFTVLALDDTVERALKELFPYINILRESDLVEFEPRLIQTKLTRSRIEQYFTQTPILVKKVLRSLNSNDICVYLDADLYFFQTPDKVLEEMGDASIGIIEHKYTNKMSRKLSKYGKYNVGWVGIRNDLNGLACAEWWSESCLTWCFDKPENGKFADQGYLNSFTELFNGVRVLENPGFNLAPWNVANYKFSRKMDSIYIDEKYPLVFFHFHGVSKSLGRYFSSEIVYRARLNRKLREFAYKEYVFQLEAIRASFWENFQRSKASTRGNGVRVSLLKLRKQIFRVISLILGYSIKTKGTI